MDAEGNRLTRTAIDLEQTQKRVTAGCHFSVDAAEDISADPVLGPVFARHAHWLVSTPGIESIDAARRSEEHTSELQSLMRISYAVFCLQKKKNKNKERSTATINRY